MIKNWEMFNESDIYFDNSPEFDNILQKYALKKEDIKQFLDELQDECDFEIDRFSNGLVSIDEKGFEVNISIKISKNYEIREGIDGYLEFLKEHTKDLEYYLKIMNLIQETESLKNLSIRSNQIPQPQFTNLKGNVSKKLELVVIFTQEIKTKEMKVALDKWTKEQSLAGEILVKVINGLVKRGLDRNEVAELIEIDPDWEEHIIITYGIWDDDDLHIIAEYDKKTKVLGFDDNLIDDLKRYLDEE
jgi:hypothetical protein